MHSRISELPHDVLLQIIQEIDPGARHALWYRLPGFEQFSLFSNDQADLKSSNALYATNQFFQNLLQPAHIIAMRKKIINFFEKGQVNEIVKKFPELVLLKQSFYDSSGRFFENVSIYQYAHWALDRHLWQAMDEVVDKSQHQSLKQILNEQLIELDHQGINYTYEDQAINEKYYNLDVIINAFNDHINQRDPWSLAQRIEHWVKTIGKIQSAFPNHIVSEICQTEKFEPLPDFKKSSLTRKLKFYYKHNENIGDYYNWYAKDNGNEVGKNVAILKTNEGATALTVPTKTLDIIALKTNMDAMKFLKQARLAEYDERLQQAIHQNSIEVPQKLPMALTV